MNSKRQYSQLEEGDQAQLNPKRKREHHSQNRTFSITVGNLRTELDIEKDIVPYVVRLARSWVREEVESKLLRPNIDESGPSEAKFFKLIFMNELPATIFKFSKIKAKEGKAIEIGLYDVRSNSIVTEGPMSCMEIKICVLNGEFGSNGEWTTQGFKAKISLPGNNRGQILKGDTVIKLKNGVGCSDNIQFLDNSSKTRSGRFRLGAMVQSASNEAHIKEAISNSFMVKEPNKKHYPPSLHDEVWHLEGISKDGKTHGWLAELGINTVKDLLQANPSSLLQQEKSSNNARRNMIKEAIKHANTCPQARLPSLQIQDFGQPSTSTSILKEWNGDFSLLGTNVPTELAGGVNSENGFPLLDNEFGNDFSFP